MNAWKETITDTGAYRDFFTLVMVYAPDFPEEDYLAAEEQLDLDTAFEILREGLGVVRPRLNDLEIEMVKRALDVSEAAFRAGDERTGGRTMQDLEDRLFRHPRSLTSKGAVGETPPSASVFSEARLGSLPIPVELYTQRIEELGSAAAYVGALREIGWFLGRDETDVASVVRRIEDAWRSERLRVYEALADLELHDAFDGGKAYADLIAQLAAMSRGRFRPTAVTESAELREEDVWLRVSFEHSAQRYDAHFIQYDKWFREEVSELLGRAFADAGIEERLVSLPSKGVCFVRPEVFLDAIRDGLIPNTPMLDAMLNGS